MSWPTPLKDGRGDQPGIGFTGLHVICFGVFMFDEKGKEDIPVASHGKTANN